MKSVLHVALMAPNGYSNVPLMNAFFENKFVDYVCFDYQLEMFSSGIDVTRKKLINIAEHSKPDLIFLHVQSSEVLDLETVKILSGIGFTVLYTFDCRTKEQAEWMYRYAPHIGLVCFSNKEDVDECASRGIHNTMVLQSSCDMDVYKESSWINIREGIVFVGCNYVNTNLDFPLAKERADMVEYLERHFDKMFVAHGLGWKHGGLVQTASEKSIYHLAKIAISHNNFDRELYTSDRIWRIMATGTFCLTKYFKGIETMFDRGIHLDWWHDFDELRDKINFYLGHPIDRKQIAHTGMLHVREKHTWSARVQEMMMKIRGIKPDERPCKDAHRVKGELPQTEEHVGICDCGKLEFKWEECGCIDKKYQIRTYQIN